EASSVLAQAVCTLKSIVSANKSPKEDEGETLNSDQPQVAVTHTTLTVMEAPTDNKRKSRYIHIDVDRRPVAEEDRKRVSDLIEGFEKKKQVYDEARMEAKKQKNRGRSKSTREAKALEKQVKKEYNCLRMAGIKATFAKIRERIQGTKADESIQNDNAEEGADFKKEEEVSDVDAKLLQLDESQTKLFIAVLSEECALARRSMIGTVALLQEIAGYLMERLATAQAACTLPGYVLSDTESSKADLKEFLNKTFMEAYSGDERKLWNILVEMGLYMHFDLCKSEMDIAFSDLIQNLLKLLYSAEDTESEKARRKILLKYQAYVLKIEFREATRDRPKRESASKSYEEGMYSEKGAGDSTEVEHDEETKQREREPGTKQASLEIIYSHGRIFTQARMEAFPEDVRDYMGYNLGSILMSELIRSVQGELKWGNKTKYHWDFRRHPEFVRLFSQDTISEPAISFAPAGRTTVRPIEVPMPSKNLYFLAMTETGPVLLGKEKQPDQRMFHNAKRYGQDLKYVTRLPPKESKSHIGAVTTVFAHFIYRDVHILLELPHEATATIPNDPYLAGVFGRMCISINFADQLVARLPWKIKEINDIENSQVEEQRIEENKKAEQQKYSSKVKGRLKKPMRKHRPERNKRQTPTEEIVFEDPDVAITFYLKTTKSNKTTLPDTPLARLIIKDFEEDGYCCFGHDVKVIPAGRGRYRHCNMAAADPGVKQPLTIATEKGDIFVFGEGLAAFQNYVHGRLAALESEISNQLNEDPEVKALYAEIELVKQHLRDKPGVIDSKAFKEAKEKENALLSKIGILKEEKRRKFSSLWDLHCQAKQLREELKARIAKLQDEISNFCAIFELFIIPEFDTKSIVSRKMSLDKGSKTPLVWFSHERLRKLIIQKVEANGGTVLAHAETQPGLSSDGKKGLIAISSAVPST
ncbi:hypothetical protein HDU96_008749, partial [Phlyctochytrium bullatum]